MIPIIIIDLKLDPDVKLQSVRQISYVLHYFFDSMGPIRLFSIILSHFSLTTENYITEACNIQDKLLARKQYLLNEMSEMYADKRKYDCIHEQDKQKNIILKIMIKEFHNKLMFLRNLN